MVLTQPRVLTFKEETVRGNAAWWKQSGLDYLKLVTALPTLLGVCSTNELQAKLNFLRDIAKLSVADLNCGGPFFLSKLDKLSVVAIFLCAEARRAGTLQAELADLLLRRALSAVCAPAGCACRRKHDCRLQARSGIGCVPGVGGAGGVMTLSCTHARR